MIESEELSEKIFLVDPSNLIKCGERVKVDWTMSLVIEFFRNSKRNIVAHSWNKVITTKRLK